MPWLRQVWPTAFTRDGTATKERPALWSSQDTTLRTALAAQAAVFRLPEQDVTSDDVERLALAWRNALRDAATLEHLQRRSLVAGEPDAALILGRLNEQLRDDFAFLLRLSSARWSDVLELCAPLVEALRLVRQEALRELEELADQLERRVTEGRALPPMDEWLDWQTLRVSYERLVSAGEPEDRRLAFAAVGGPVASLAVWLANDRDQRPASHALFRWLQREASGAGDHRARELHERNTDITREG
jgi:hypothetical protein